MINKIIYIQNNDIFEGFENLEMGIAFEVEINIEEQKETIESHGLKVIHSIFVDIIKTNLLELNIHNKVINSEPIHSVSVLHHFIINNLGKIL